MTSIAVALVFVGYSAHAQSPDTLESFSLKSSILHNTRAIHILLPPDYRTAANAKRSYPVCYFLDGRAAFDDGGWGVVPTVRALWARREIPEMIFVGIDNGGSTAESKHPVVDRASEFLPYQDQSWTTPPLPVPHGREHPDFLLNEVIPAVSARYRVDPKAGLCLAGDSYAGAAAVYAAIAKPGRIQRLLLESPSLHIGNRRLLTDAKAVSKWPARIWIGVGTAEGETPEAARNMTANARELSVLLAQQPTVMVKLKEVPGAVHSYEAWRARLPEALRFLLGSDPDPGSPSVH